MSERHRAQVRRWKELHRRGTRPGTWRDQYEAELEKFLLWCLEKGLPFKWAMIRAMRAYTKHDPHDGSRPARTIETRDGSRTWRSVNACARDLGVWPNAVATALKKGSRCKGLRLAYEKPAARSFRAHGDHQT